MKPHKTSVIDRVRTFIHEARLRSQHPNSAPDLLHIIMGPKPRKAVRSDDELQKLIEADGWRVQIMRYLKDIRNGELGEEGMTKEQADFWPATVRHTVVDIDRARVFVPSRMEYVPLMPQAISKDELQEAGQYLIKKGNECIRVGNLLLQLSRSI
jgi:hypothetical protein